ncbi:MAG: hypothetical protein ACJ8GN_04005 [Longimicrobiaceae bacterium]
MINAPPVFASHTPDALTPILASVPLQLLTCHVAVPRGIDVERNAVEQGAQGFASNRSLREFSAP